MLRAAHFVHVETEQERIARQTREMNQARLQRQIEAAERAREQRKVMERLGQLLRTGRLHLGAQ